MELLTCFPFPLNPVSKDRKAIYINIYTVTRLFDRRRQRYILLPNNLTFRRLFGGRRLSENNVGKGENVDNQHFLLFQQCFGSIHIILLQLSYIYFVVC